MLAVLDGDHALYKVGKRLEERGMVALLQPGLTRAAHNDYRLGHILDALFAEVRKFAEKVQRGEAQLKNGQVNIKPPDPIGELGSGWGKVREGEKAGVSLPVVG